MFTFNATGHNQSFTPPEPSDMLPADLAGSPHETIAIRNLS
jgi:hypothetical protein